MAPGLYIPPKQNYITCMVGMYEYYRIKKTYKKITCSETTHEKFLEANWTFIGPAQVTQW